MFPVLMLSSFAGVLPEAVIDQMVSKRVVIAERKVCLDLAIRTGDPLGSREEGTLKTISEPKLVTYHKREALLRAGGRQAMPDGDGGVKMEPVGIEVLVTPVLRLDEKIQLDGMIRETEVNHGRGLRTPTGFFPGVDERTVRYSMVVRPGQRVKLRVSSRSASDQTWVEFVANVQEMPGVVEPAK